MVSLILVEGYSHLWHIWGTPFLMTSPPWTTFVCRNSSPAIMPSTLVTSVNARPKNVLFSCTSMKSGLDRKQKHHWAVRYPAKKILSGSFKRWKISAVGVLRGLWGPASQSLSPKSRTGQARGQLGQLQPLDSAMSAKHQPPGGSGLTQPMGRIVWHWRWNPAASLGQAQIQGLQLCLGLWAGWDQPWIGLGH